MTIGNGTSNGVCSQDSQVNGYPRRQAQRSELRPMPVTSTNHVDVESKTLPLRNGINGVLHQRDDPLSASKPQEDNVKPKKKLILNAFVEMCSGHQSPGLWR